MSKPYSAAAERNRVPILDVLRERFADRRHVLEIGSGTGQHAVYFAQALPQLIWQSSDRDANLPGIAMWLAEAKLANTPIPLRLDVNDKWPSGLYDAVYTANTLHIMSWPEVETCFAHLPTLLAPHALLVVYGPFNYGGQFTSDSNACFDSMLRADDPQRGIRDFEAVDKLATAAGLTLVEDTPMPANNRCITWRYTAA